MSAQASLDYQLSEKGGYNYNITLHGKSGPLVVPENVNLNLFDSNITDLTVEGNNAIFIARSKITGLLEARDCSFIADETEFLGECFWRESSKVELTASSFGFRASFHDNTIVDLSQCGWKGYGSWALRFMNKSRGVVSNGTIQMREKGIWAMEGSYVETYNVTFATVIGMIAEEDSIIRAVYGQMKCTDIGAHAKERSRIYVSQMLPWRTPTNTHVVVEDRSQFHSEGTDYLPPAKTAFDVKDNSLCEAFNFDSILTLEDTIKISEDSRGLFVSGGQIKSIGKRAIVAKDLGTVVRFIDIDLIEGIQQALKIEKDAQAVFTKVVTTQSLSEQAVDADSRSKVSFKNCTTVESKVKEAIKANDDSRVWLAGVPLVKGLQPFAVILTNEADFSVQDCGQIIGEAGGGISAVDNCTVQFQGLGLCEGKTDVAITLKNNTNLDAIYFDLIESKTDIAIVADSNCDIRLARSKSVKGFKGGVYHTNLGDLIIEILEDITVDPEGTGRSISAQNDIDANIKLVNSMSHGIETVDSFLKAAGCPGINNPNFAGVEVTGGTVDLRKIVASGASVSVRLYRTDATADNTTLDQSILSQESTVHFSGVTLNGDITSQNDAITLQRVTMTGDLIGVDSTFYCEVGSYNGNIVMSGGVVDLRKTAVSGVVDLADNSMLKTALATASSMNLTSSVAELLGGDMGPITTDGSSSVISSKCGSQINGSGNVISMDGGTVGTGQNRITMGDQKIEMKNKMEALVKIDMMNIEVDAQSGGGDVTIKSTTATHVE